MGHTARTPRLRTALAGSLVCARARGRAAIVQTLLSASLSRSANAFISMAGCSPKKKAVATRPGPPHPRARAEASRSRRASRTAPAVPVQAVGTIVPHDAENYMFSACEGARHVGARAIVGLDEDSREKTGGAPTTVPPTRARSPSRARERALLRS